MIVLVDYKKGNLQSVARGLQAVGADVRVTAAPEEIAAARAIVLPGVGAFTDAMKTMEELGQVEAIRGAVGRGVPFLGICLGLHLMFEAGEEHTEGDGFTPGLGLLPGIVRRMPRTDERGTPYKVPHVGWNSVEFGAGGCPLFDGISSGEYFYFTHSYIAPECEAAVGRTRHSVDFPSAVWQDNLFGVQFHPEKSSDVGAKLLANFVGFVNGRA